MPVVDRSGPVTTSEQQAVPVAQGPASIWLSPICDETANHGDGRTWASPAPDAACEDCGLPWVEYVRADLSHPCKSGEGAVSVSEAIRRAKQHAGRVLGISWCNLEEISRVELILAALTPDATQTREAEGLRLIIEKYVPLGIVLDADTRAACIEDIVDDLTPLSTDGRVKLVASALCRSAGMDPDGGARGGYSWVNHEADARTLLAALNARGGA